VKITFADSTALTFTGLFANNFLPTTIWGDVVRLAGAMQLGYDRAVCLASLAADRLVGALGGLFTLPLGLIPALHILGHGASQSFIFSTLFSQVTDFIKRTIQTFSIWLKHPLALLAALGCTWGHMLCNFLMLYVLIEGLGGHVGFWLIAGLWSLAYFVTLIPISINGLGVQELSQTFLFSAVAGLSTPVSLTIAVLFRAFYVIASLIGAFYLPGILSAMAASGENANRVK
jgi:glycosyltransferase 2 family protein